MHDTALPETDAEEPTALPSPPPPQPQRSSGRGIAPRTAKALYLILGITLALFVGLVIYLAVQQRRAPTLAEQVPDATRAYYNQCAQDAAPCLGDYYELSDGTVEQIQSEHDFDRLRRGGDRYLLAIAGIARNDGSDPVRYSEYAQRYWHGHAAPVTSPPAGNSQPEP